MSENFTEPNGQTMTVRVDHSHVEMLERERADKEKAEKEAAQKELAELKAKQAQEDEKKKNSANGVVALQSIVGGRQLQPAKRSGGFEDYSDMVASLKKDEKNGSQEAKNILNALWVKSFANVDKPEHFELEGNLSDLVSCNGKARFVQKRSLPDNEQENRELEA
jgi:hypothetical protein